LSMSTNGVISGTPGMATNASFTVEVFDSSFNSAASAFTLTITAAPPAPSLAVAINQPAWVVTTSASQPWFSQTTNTHDGASAAQSGPFTAYQESWMKTTVTGPGELTYWWKMSAGTGVGYLEFYLDDVFQWDSDPSFWQNETIAIPAGSHTVMWVYVKGSSANASVWVDEVTLVPGAPPRPTIIVNDGNFGFLTNGFGFNLNGIVGQIVAVEASTNLLVWRALLTNTMTGSPFYFKDTNTASYPRRFYRLRSP